jgi:hypothetical protein
MIAPWIISCSSITSTACFRRVTPTFVCPRPCADDRRPIDPYRRRWTRPGKTE